MPTLRALFAWTAAAMLSAATAVPAEAACYPMAGIEPRIVPASFDGIAAVPRNHVRIDFVGHVSFEIESPAGVRILTDHNGFRRPARLATGRYIHPRSPKAARSTPGGAYHPPDR